MYSHCKKTYLPIFRVFEYPSYEVGLALQQDPDQSQFQVIILRLFKDKHILMIFKDNNLIGQIWLRLKDFEKLGQK